MGPMESLAQELLNRQMAQQQQQVAPSAYTQQKPDMPSMKPLHPELLAAVGAGLDGVSTYKFLKEGTRQEGNPMLQAMFHNDPVKTGLGAAGTGLALMGARKALSKWGGPIGKKLSPILAAQQGMDQLVLGLDNFQLEKKSTDPRNGFEKLSDLKTQMLSRYK